MLYPEGLIRSVASYMLTAVMMASVVGATELAVVDGVSVVTGIIVA